MRTIKFRAWDGTFDKKMFIVDRLSYTYDRTKVLATKMDYSSENAKFEQLKEKSGQFPIMQFTGLLDKHGKEIYEGDIVKLKENEYYFERSGEVIFEEGTFKIKNVELWNDGTYNHYSLEILDTEFCEIIGNIHENKDLIK